MKTLTVASHPIIGRRRLLNLALQAGLLFGAHAVHAAPAEPDPQELLRRSDQARGGGLPGLAWELEVRNTNATGDDTAMRLRIKAIDDASLAETLEPARSKGAKMLQVERNMWLTKPGLKKPVPISPRQRLSGQAAIGDIASTNYARDYEARLLREELVGDERCYVLDLTARQKQSTYDSIHYWVSVERGLGIKAEFRSLSGKLLKTAEFRYGNTITVRGRSLPFVSRMAIADALSDARTVLDYSRLQVRAIASSEFDLDRLE